MSTQELPMDMPEARRLAVKRARQSYGTFIRVGEGEYDKEEKVFRFPLEIRRPQIIKESDGDSVMSVRFHPKQDLKHLTVNAETRDIDAPHREHLFSLIRNRQDEIDVAVRKALVTVSGKSFAHLPFLENQFAPLEDVLAELILNKSIQVPDIEERDEDRGSDRYSEYVEDLIELDLANRRDGEIRAGGKLLGFMDEHSELYEKALNDAMGVYFQHNVDKFQMINRSLGPYLVIAGRYYQQALIQQEIPTIHEKELRDAIQAEYTGKRRRRSLFKLSHYLIQLQEVGILESERDDGVRYWEGHEQVREDLENQADAFEPIQELLSTYN